MSNNMKMLIPTKIYFESFRLDNWRGQTSASNSRAGLTLAFKRAPGRSTGHFQSRIFIFISRLTFWESRGVKWCQSQMITTKRSQTNHKRSQTIIKRSQTITNYHYHNVGMYIPSYLWWRRMDPLNWSLTLGGARRLFGFAGNTSLWRVLTQPIFNNFIDVMLSHLYLPK